MITTTMKEESESACSGMAPLDNAMDNNSRSDCHRLAEDSMNMRCWARWLRSGGFAGMGTWRDGGGADGVSGLFVQLGVVAGNLEDNETLTTLTALMPPIC